MSKNLITYMPSISKENYIKAVYQLCENVCQTVSTSALATKLNITNAATSDMAKGLSKQGFIKYEKYKGVSLTPKGKKTAIGILRRHRLWELFLMKSLGLGWEEVHTEAEHLEHQTTEFLMNKIDDFLGNPKFDPHGEPIPQKDGKIPIMPKQISLNKSKVGKEYIVMRVNDESKEVMNYFTNIGLNLNSKIRINNYLEYDNSIIIELNDKIHSFSEKISDKIFISPINTANN